MSTRGRSTSPQERDADVDMDKQPEEKLDAKVVVVTNLTRNVVEAHLQSVFGFYGEIVKIDLPIYVKSGQNKGKAYLEYADPASARTALSHMNGGQLDGAALKVELSDMPLQRTRARTRSRSPPFRPRNGRERERERPRSLSRSRSRSPLPPPRFPRRERGDFASGPGRGGYNDSYRRPPPPLGRRPPARDVYRPRTRTRSRSRSRSPIRRGGVLGPRRRSPSYERGGYGRRGRSASYSSVRSSRSRSRTPSRSRSRSRSFRSRSFSRSRSRTRSRSRSRSPSYSSYSRGRSRSRSYSRGRRSYSRDDIRDSRSRSPYPKDP